MTGIIFLVIYGTLCGFYSHVLLHLHREHKLMNPNKRRLQFYFHRAGSDSENAWIEKISGYRASRNQALTDLVLGMGGLAALFVGIELFNLFVTRH
jgi:hypothetical protein